MAEGSSLNLVASEFASQVSHLFRQVDDLQCRVSSLEHSLSDADNKQACSLPSRTDASARVVHKLEEVTFYRPLFPSIPGFELRELDATAPPLGLHSKASRIGPAVVQWDTSVNLGEVQVGRARPESMLNYCITRLALSKRPWRDSALRYLLVLVASQQLLLGTFLISSDIKGVAYGKGSQQMSLMDCALADAWTISGQSATKIVAVCVSMFLIASLLKTNDMEQLELVYYLKRELGWGLWSFLMWVWFIQVVYLPATFCTEASILFAGSADASDIVMNGLAMVYMVEIDNTLYWSILDPEDREAYQRESQNLFSTCTTQRHVAWYARFLFTASMGYMFLIYAIGCNTFSFLQGNLFVKDALVFSWQILHALRSTASFSMLQTPLDSEWTPSCFQRFLHGCFACLIFLVAALISNFWCQFIMGLLTGNVDYDYVLLQKAPGCTESIERAQQGTSHL